MLKSILESITHPIVFVDNQHIIRYVNKAAKEKYGKKGHLNLVGTSILQYHNERSRKIILDTYEMLENSEEDEKLLVMKSAGQKILIRAVRDASGKLIGYYERFEP